MDKKERHESYGLLQIGRINGGSRNLFGSSIKHNNTISLRVKPASKSRNLNTDWFYDEGVSYIEVEMSQTQFAEAITSLNCGSGTPVTVRRINGKNIEECPEENKRQEFEKEFEQQMECLGNKLFELTKRTEEILSNKKTLNKSEKEEILNAIKGLKAEIKSNIPFMGSMFNEQMDKTSTEAKGEVEAFWLNKIHSLGVKGLEKEVLMLNEENNK